MDDDDDDEDDDADTVLIGGAHWCASVLESAIFEAQPFGSATRLSKSEPIIIQTFHFDSDHSSEQVDAIWHLVRRLDLFISHWHQMVDFVDFVRFVCKDRRRPRAHSDNINLSAELGVQLISVLHSTGQKCPVLNRSLSHALALSLSLSL